MKTILLITFVYLITFKADAQLYNETIIKHPDVQSLSYNQLQVKIHQQEKAALIFGITGGTICLTGLVLEISSLGEFADPSAHHNHYGNAPEILTFGGLAIMSIGIPFSIMAKKNKKRARLYMQKENVSAVTGIKGTYLISACIKLNF